MASTLRDGFSGLRNRLSSPAGQESDQKFGAFNGVFVPTVLTILGVIMYLRLGWVVGNAGLVGAILIILMAHVVTVSTGLAVSSIATNIRVGAGGAFPLISQSLGLEVGGSVSVPLYLAQGISIALYILGFSSGVLNIFPELPEIAVALGTFAVILAIAYISAQFASRVQLIILAIVTLSLFSIFMGGLAIGDRAGMNIPPTLWGDFPAGNFWVVFAVFFPAVTGIMVGISMSGELRDPRKSIPLGTMSAIAVTLVIYILLTIWLSRVATVEELLNIEPGNIVMADKAYWPPLVVAGLLGATFSSALASMVAAPRVMQALAEHGILPRSSFIAQDSESGEPRRALLITAAIALVTLVLASLSGGLNAIAPLISMFFMITYGTLNAVVVIEQSLGMVSFRPTLAIPRWVPLVGLLSCLFVMTLINPIFSLLAIILTLAIYAYLLRKNLRAPWGDVRSGLFLALAEWAGERVSRLPGAPERTWSPNILAPITDAETLNGSYRFLRAIASPQGSVRALGLYKPGQRASVERLGQISHAFTADGVFSRTTLLKVPDFETGLITSIEVLDSIFFRPNMLFMPLFPERQEIDLERILTECLEFRIGVALLARHPVVDLGREQLINVWVREQGPAWELGMRLSNLDLSVLLAYQLARNWHGQVSLCMAVNDEETASKAQDYLHELVTLARLQDNTQVRVIEGSFHEALRQVPSADINLFGLPDDFRPGFLQEIINIVDASCLFVRDSGDESALA
ncbi:MAG: amino acid permease [Chloroflexota bacterium]|jgi:amino acid transporter